MRTKSLRESLLAAAIGVALETPTSAEVPAERMFQTAEVGRGVYAFLSPETNGPIPSSNVVAIVGDDGVLVVDSGRFPSLARRILQGLQSGKLDRSEMTSNANAYFTEQAVADFAASLGPLGAPSEVKLIRSNDRGGMTFRFFEVKFPQKKVAIWERDMPDGKIEQFEVMATD